MTRKNPSFIIWVKGDSLVMIHASNSLKEYLKLTKITNKEFAERIGFDEATVSQVLSKKEEPSKMFIEKVLLNTDLKFDSAFEVKE